MRLNFRRISITDKLLGLIETEKTSDRLLLRVMFFAVIILGVFSLFTINKDFSYPVPTSGGVLVEGIVGIPRFINPALAITRADQDTVALVYSGLMKIDTNGVLQPDIAENIAISEDGKIYTVTIKKDRYFHDGTPITAQDVAYTIALIQNPDLKSPLRGNWTDVTVEEVNEYELTITLAEAYSPFIENFTLGIMPKHIWSTLPIEQLPFSQHNTLPIGSGPFKIEEVHRDTSGLISGYTLQPSADSQHSPNLSGIELRYFQNENLLSSAMLNKEITSTVYLPNKIVKQLNEENYHIITRPLPKIYGIFFNQNKSSALRDESARLALSKAVDRDKIVNEVLLGYGVPISKPILESISELNSSSTVLESDDNSTSTLEEAKQILIAGDWKQNEAGFWEKEIDKTSETLSVTIKTSNANLFDQTINRVADDWRKLGVEVQIEQYEQTGLVQSVIRPRDFQALLFGLDMNRTEDLYPFWHSSQKDDPGLNISQYTNISVDRLLEKSRNSQDQNERKTLLSEASNAIYAEMPAVFLFAPSVVYVVDKNIITTPIQSLGKPADRFMNVSDWYAKTETVWPIFRK